MQNAVIIVSGQPTGVTKRISGALDGYSLGNLASNRKTPAEYKVITSIILEIIV